MFTRDVPRWIPVGGFVLAAIAGCINAVGLLGLDHHAISHLSGNITSVGISLAAADWTEVMRIFLVILWFFLGCLLSSLIIRQNTLQLGRRYGVALTLEAGVLLLATWFLRHGAVRGQYFAALACGLQNAMATSYSGAVLRTTHMTGIVTDLGIAVGLWARRQPVDWRRIRLYLILLAGFSTGSVLGAIGFAVLRYDTLLIPAAIAGLTGITYTIYQHRRSA